MARMNTEASQRVPDFTYVGPNRIQRLLWPSPLGEVYEVVLGTTSHEYGLLVIDPELCPLPLEAVRDCIAPLLRAQDPCLAKPFACGENNGHLWIRMELTEAVRISLFSGVRRRSSHDDEEDEEERIEDATELLSLYGPLQPAAFAALLGDLIEGLAAVHSVGARLGPLALTDIGFDQWMRHSGFPVVAKWCNYGLLPLLDPARAAAWTPQDDFRMMAQLARQLLSPDDAWPEWADFLDRAEDPNGFADTKVLVDAYEAILKAHKTVRNQRIRPEDTIAPTASPTRGPIRRRSSHASSHSGHSSHSSRSRHHRSGHSSGVRSTHVWTAIAIVAGIGCAVAYTKPKLVTRLIDSIRYAKAGRPATSVTQSADAGKPAETNLWEMSFEALRDASEAGAAPSIKMRYAFELAQGSTDRDPDTEVAGAIAAEAFQSMQEMPADASRGDADFWMGYALLAGLGVEANPVQALVHLERAESDGDLHAKSLLADYYSSGGEDGHTAENDAAALNRWFEIVEAGDPAQGLTPEARRCGDKIAAFFFAHRALPDHEQDAYVARIRAIAQRHHLPCILAVARIYLEGKIDKLDEAAAKRWYSDAAQIGSPEGMYHMAWMLERGIASTPSDRAAAIWYRRAASGGNADAMRSLARLLREQRVKNDAGEPLASEGGKTAVEWEAAAEAATPPPFLPYTSWWLGVQANRFPDPPSVRAE